MNFSKIITIYLGLTIILTIFMYLFNQPVTYLTDFPNSMTYISKYCAETLLPLVVTYIAIISSFGKIALLKNDSVLKTNLLDLMFTWLGFTALLSFPALLSYDFSLGNCLFFDQNYLDQWISITSLLTKLYTATFIVCCILFGHNMKTLHHLISTQISEKATTD
ncbi:MAG: hypothetical protein ACOYOK_16430 [Pseudobdellovibrionaceae bacterium]|jgi:hypothetical protein